MPDQKDAAELDGDIEFDGEFDPDRAKRTIIALRAERKELRQQVQELTGKNAGLEGEARFHQLQAQFGDFLAQDDFDGLPPEKWEDRAKRLAELRGGSESPKPGEENANGKTPVNGEPAKEHPNAEALKKASTIQGGAAVTEPVIVGASEALAKVRSGEWTEADYRRNADRRLAAKAGAR